MCDIISSSLYKNHNEQSKSFIIIIKGSENFILNIKACCFTITFLTRFLKMFDYLFWEANDGPPTYIYVLKERIHVISLFVNNLNCAYKSSLLLYKK